MITAIICCAALCAIPTLAVAQNTERPRPPNILLIIADDQGYADLGCTGLADDVKTPSIDALVQQGVRFTQAYATSPICNASRAGLITGCYQQRFGTYWYGGKGLHDARYTTIPELLAKCGYVTGYVGKFHYGSYKVSRPGQRSFPLDHGFGSMFGFAGGRKHYLVHNESAESAFSRSRREHKRKGQSLKLGAMWVGSEKEDQEGLSTELFGNRARQFMRANRDKPFFLQLAFNAIHNFTHQLPKEYLEKHNLRGYRDWDAAREEYYDWYTQGRYPNNPEGRAHYLGQLHYLDIEVGRVIAELDTLGLRDNTIVIYISDNGGSTPIYANNTPLRGSKYTLYEGGIRIPFIISWPRHFESGALCDNLVSTLDLLPTICKAASVPVPSHLDGLDLSPVLTGEKTAVGHETLVWDTNHETAVRHGKWKLRTAKSNRHADREMVELELGTFLYDLEQDLGESVNLADKHPEILAQLEQIHRDWRAGLRLSSFDK